MCSPHQTAYNGAVRWEKRKPVIEPGMSAAWRSFSAMAARSISSLISAQSAGTNVVLYREYKLRPELVETGNACALPYTVTRICLLPLKGAVLVLEDVTDKRLIVLLATPVFDLLYKALSG